MRNIFILFFALFLSFPPVFSFAQSREEIIEETLRKQELSDNEITRPYNSRVAEALREFVNLSDISDEREDAIEQAFYISGGYDFAHMHYSEWDGEDKLDENYGSHNGFYVTLGYKSPDYNDIILAKPFIEGYYRYYRGSIKYKGAASDGFTSYPFDTMQDSSMQRYGIKFGGYGEFLQKGELSVYFDVGDRIWHRGQNEIVDNVYNYAEKYTWVYFGIGAGINYKVIPRLSVGIDGEWVHAISRTARMRADLYEGGTFKLKDVWGAEVKTPIRYLLLKNLSLDITPYFTYWSIKRSDPVMISGYYYFEPDSRTHEEGLLAGLTFIF